jgi:C4-dicarboxylate-specific signal transduction histidine kinase
MPADPPVEEIKRLQRCINDLISVLAFPAMWAGRSPADIVRFFVDGLIRILRLDVVFVRLTDETDGPQELLRTSSGTDPEAVVARDAFAALGDEPAQWPRQLFLDPTGRATFIAPFRLGLRPGYLVVAGSQRADFPIQTEQLLLNVAANQLLLAFHEAQLRIKQTRITEELDARVAQRTAELAATNAELLKEIAERRRAEDALLASERARTELANVTRATSLGVLAASIAHEVNQPLSGIITNAGTCLRMLSTEPPNVEGALETARRTIRDGKRASEVISRLRALYVKKDLQPEPMDLNEAAREVSALSLSELQRNRVTVRHELADGLPPVRGDRIQLQQVILNLLRNASDSMSSVENRERELLIKTEADDCGAARLSVTDAGIGFSAQAAERIFEPFYTTKNDGMGIGLSVSRSIIEAHSGKLWATPNEGPGVTFTFTVPVRS